MSVKAVLCVVILICVTKKAFTYVCIDILHVEGCIVLSRKLRIQFED